MAKKKYEPQTKTVEADIPNAELKKPKPIKLKPIVQNERDMRRYIRKDGVFRKDFECLWNRNTGKHDAMGNMGRVQTKTKGQAEKIIRDLCKKSGRKVEKDTLTGRFKAVPGWDLTIRVPGMLREEQKAPKAPEGEARQKISDSLLLTVEKDNKQLKAELAEIKDSLEMGRVKSPAPQKAKKQG